MLLTQNRWWIYQQERFPIIKNGLLIAVFSSSAVGYSCLLRGDRTLPSLSSLLVAFISIFIFFLQLRIADEFKDFSEDARYRSYRPVPRGLVSLDELGWIGIFGALIQLGLSFYLSPWLVLVLGGVWLYIGLMSQEFFVPKWLKAHPLIYMLSHMLIMPLINLYGTACDWSVTATTFPFNGLWFLVASFFNGMVIEIGRKIRASNDEEFGVETYSSLWGYKNAVQAWLLALGCTAIAAWLAAYQIQAVTLVGFVVVTLLFCAVGLGWVFGRQPITKWANLIETMSGLWTLFVYLSLGIMPILLQIAE
jgi:4-hydroxybenzoate polyprenyltransferase